MVVQSPSYPHQKHGAISVLSTPKAGVNKHFLYKISVLLHDNHDHYCDHYYNQNDHHKSNQKCLHECRVLLHGRKSPWALLLLLTGIDCDNDQDHDADEDDNHDGDDNEEEGADDDDDDDHHSYSSLELLQRSMATSTKTQTSIRKPSLDVMRFI